MDAPIQRQDAVLVGLVCLVGLACLFPALGQSNRWGSHEARHAQVAREMLLTGQYAVPRICGAVSPSLDKPPLFHWAVALSYRLLGRVNEFSMRLPTALAAVAGGVGVFLMGRLLFGRSVGFVAALMLLTTASYAEWGMMCRMDILMTVLMLYAALLGALGARAGRAWVSALLWLGAGLLWGAAVLSKGIGGLGLGLTTLVLTWLCLSRRPILVIPMSFLALATALAVFYLWTLRVAAGDYYEHMLTYNLGMSRTVNPGPFYYYVTRYPVRFLPHVLWVPFAVWWLARQWRIERRWDRLYPLLVTAAGLLALSFVGEKRHHYMLPLAPFSAVLAAQFVTPRLRADLSHMEMRMTLWPAAVWLLAAPGVGLAAALALPGRDGVCFVPVELGLAAMVAVTAIGLRLVLQRRVLAAVLLAGVQSLLMQGAVAPAASLAYWRPDACVRAAREIALVVPPDRPVALGPNGRDEVSFCLAQLAGAVNSAAEAAVYARGAGERFIVTPPEYLDHVAARVGARLRVRGAWRVSEKEQAVVIQVLPADAGP